jgi:hypothetical protein
MKDNWRTGVEFLGLLIVAGSLLFVAQQIKQERTIALAQLNATQLEVFVSRFNSGLESGPYLSMWSKRYLTNLWDRDGLTDEEVAAAELDGLIWWAYAEMAFENYREGLSTENAWREMEVEIKVFSAGPVHRAVYDYWYSQTPSEFTRKVDELIRSAAHTASK